MESRAFDDPASVVEEARPVATLERRPGHALGRVFRMQVEGEPLQLGAVPALQPRRPFEGDVAERSYVVGPHDELRSVFHG